MKNLESNLKDLASQYLEFIHGTSFPRKARNRRLTDNRLAVSEIPFWKNIDLGKIQATLLKSESELFVNVSLDPDDYYKYLSRVVPYADKVILADPIASIYEMRDRSAITSTQFKSLLDYILGLLLPLYPLIEEGILILLPQPFLWSQDIDLQLSNVLTSLSPKIALRESILTDYELGLNKNDLIQRWLDKHSDVPDGWKNHEESYAEVNIFSGKMHDLLNGIFLSMMINGHTTSSSLNAWNHLKHLYSELQFYETKETCLVGEILPLTELPYISNPDWSKLVAYRNELELFIDFRKQVMNIVSDLNTFAPKSNDIQTQIDHLSSALRMRVDELINKREILFNVFEPTLAKGIIAGISALFGNQPLALSMTGLAIFDACKTIRNFRLDLHKLKKNPLFAVFHDCTEK